MMSSQMEQEARAAPQFIAEQLIANTRLLETIAAHVRSVQPIVAMTVARGSSDHAATFAKYLLETHAGMICASAAPSVFTIYQKKLPLKNCLVLGLSQSGESPDLYETFVAANEAGAITVAFVNQIDSPLAEVAEYVVPLGVGTEVSVAASKSYLAMLSALIQFVAILTNDETLLQALEYLPEYLKLAAQKDWSAAISSYQNCQSTFVVGRGFGFPIAQETALKFKETAKIHAEAFSAADLLHGPFALVEKNFPVLLFAQQDASFDSMMKIAERLKKVGASVLLAAPQGAKDICTSNISVQLPLPNSLHPVCDPLIIIQAVYIMIAQLSVMRGFNPDEPVNLTKVTRTW